METWKLFFIIITSSIVGATLTHIVVYSGVVRPEIESLKRALIKHEFHNYLQRDQLAHTIGNVEQKIMNTIQVLVDYLHTPKLEYSAPNSKNDTEQLPGGYIRGRDPITRSQNRSRRSSANISSHLIRIGKFPLPCSRDNRPGTTSVSP